MPKKRNILDGYKNYDTSHGFGDPEEWRDAFYQRMGKDQASAILEKGSETPGQILGVGPNATISEIRTAFRTLLKEWHPDKNPHRLEEAEAMTLNIIASYEMLT